MQFCSHLILHFYVGAHVHQAIFPPAPATVPAPHIAVDTLLGLTIKAKYSKTVHGVFGIPMVGAGNDSGWIIPHISIPPPNVLVPVHILLGGSKPMFSASTVQMDVDGASTPVACCVIPFAPISFNQACFDPCNLPADVVCAPTNIMVGMTLGDFLAGVLGTVLDSAISFAAGKLMGGASKALQRSIVAAMNRKAVALLYKNFGSKITLELVDEAAEQMMKPIARRAAEALIGGFLANTIGDAVPAGSATEGLRQGVDGPLPGASTPGTQGSTPVHRAE